MKIEDIKDKIKNYISIINELKEFQKDYKYNSNYYYNRWLRQPYYIRDNTNKKQYLYYEKMEEKTQDKIEKLQDKIEKLEKKIEKL